MIGDKDYIHTLWFYFPVLNVRDPGPSNAFYSGLMAYLFPTWTDGKDWHLKALATSWDFSARAYQDPMISWNEMVARAKLDGASLGATGVPPDIIVYRITARTECERISEASLEKPRRAPREPSKRNLDIQSAGLQLYYTHPVPTDVSTTPIYLGAVRGRRPDDERRLLRFDTPGPLANTLLDLDAWANVQVSPPLAPDMRSWIAEGWGYEHRFLYLVTQPVVPINSEGKRFNLLVDSAAAGLIHRGQGAVDIEWSDFSGLLFGTQLLPHVDDRRLEPPYAVVNAGNVLFENEGSAVPVDVSATATHVGLVRRYYGARRVDLPPPYEATIEDLTLVVRDGAGDGVALDLRSWFNAQAGEPLTETRARPISNPSITFELGGRAHLLVVDYAAYKAPNGVPAEVEAIGGQLFRAD